MSVKRGEMSASPSFFGEQVGLARLVLVAEPVVEHIQVSFALEHALTEIGRETLTSAPTEHLAQSKIHDCGLQVLHRITFGVCIER